MNLSLYRSAVLEADKVRMELGFDMYEPVNAFDICIKKGINVRFVDVNLEGMYVGNDSCKDCTILISNQRPFPRRHFTCAHELGHHRFGHGMMVDHVSETENILSSNYEHEKLVDSFAGSLLMPLAGLHAEFASRNVLPEDATPLTFFTVASLFGTGYSTLVVHCAINGLITNRTRERLLRHSPSQILSQLSDCDITKGHFKIVDKDSQISTLDLETCDYLFLPGEYRVEGEHLNKVKEVTTGNMYIASNPGIVLITSPNNNASFFVRIQNKGYAGLARYRHLETID